MMRKALEVKINLDTIYLDFIFFGDSFFKKSVDAHNNHPMKKSHHQMVCQV